ncbi:MAG: Uma2 family endonuclease [Cytophagaceae bacterium]|nr:Uma2 family endonuclease [Cytophagaceae bacterium]
MLTRTRPAPRRSRPTQAVPDVLIYELMDGRPLYYRGYGDVLTGKKTTEEIMGASGLQAFIIQYLLEILFTKVGRQRYHFLTNEIGNHLGKKNNLSGDLYIYERQALAPDKINNQYVDVPPKVAIEVDVKIDLTDEKNADYVHQKTQKLLDWGVEKVIWIFTNSRKVTVAETGQDWITMDWHREISLLDGQLFNIGAYLEQEGIRLEDGENE